MTKYEFDGTIYRTSQEMHVAAAKDWLIEIGDVLAVATTGDETLADWALKYLDNDAINRADLIKAFATIRAGIDDYFPEPEMIITKGLMDGATTLSEAAQQLRKYADWLEKLERNGWQLLEEVGNEYGFVQRKKRPA